MVQNIVLQHKSVAGCGSNFQYSWLPVTISAALACIFQSIAEKSSLAYVRHIPAWHSWALAQAWSQTGLIRRQQECSLELLWKVQGWLVENLPAIPQKLLLVSKRTPEEFSLYLEYSYPSESQLADLSVYCQRRMYLLASDPAPNFCEVLDLATSSTENSSF